MRLVKYVRDVTAEFFSSIDIHLWNTIWRTGHVSVLNIFLSVTSSALDRRIDRSIDMIDAKKLFLGVLNKVYVCMLRDESIVVDS